MSKLQTYIPVATRREALAATNHVCLICGQSVKLDLHHVTPEYAGGATVADNLTPLCSNKLGGNACHKMIHAVYRTKEKVEGRRLTDQEYRALLISLKQLIGGR